MKFIFHIVIIETYIYPFEKLHLGGFFVLFTSKIVLGTFSQQVKLERIVFGGYNLFTCRCGHHLAKVCLLRS